jgi:leucyl aminopeptidase
LVIIQQSFLFYRIGASMLARLETHAPILSASALAKSSHVLVVLPKNNQIPASPGAETLRTLLKRRAMKASELTETPLSATLPHGGLAAWVMLDFSKSVFEQHTLLRKAAQLLLEENPGTLCISVHGSQDERAKEGQLAVYVAWLNGARLPQRKKKPQYKPLAKIILWGCPVNEFDALHAQAEGNLLCRELTVLPPNELTPR